ncbi:MAG: response regulator [Ponticaulis sp.]|nr:response regulator [Ponticaulis sp.]
MSANVCVLFVEDNKLDRYLIGHAIAESGVNIRYHFAHHAEQAIEMLDSSNPPRLIVTDLRMPGIGGLELISHLKTDEKFRTIPVVVFSTSADSLDIQDAYDRSANSYVVKPDNMDGYKQFATRLEDYWLKENRMPC